ncbi:MAG: alpha/beta hydrolase-fold protein [Saprospiraceae bacterium]|nr:alpha/beta hydrolase-fold protein [Saprospiraceae bacterium]
MLKNIVYFLLFATLLISGCGKDNNGKNGSCYSNTDARSITHNSIDREYVLYVPSSYSSNSAAPVMLNFHGFGGSASDHMTDADMRSLAESNAFILVYPQGSCLDGVSHWNTCPSGGDNKSSADDFGFVEAMIAEISSEYNVDANRIYAVGYSNGGMMAYGLANYKSELVAAVGSVSGTMLDCTNPPSHPMPVIHLHGTSDAVLPYDGNSDYNSTQQVLDHWISVNNTSTSPVVNSDNSSGTTIEHYVYAQGDSSVSVEHYKYIGGEHVWFNTPTYQGQNAAELIWNFMSRYDINGLR